MITEIEILVMLSACKIGQGSDVKGGTSLHITFEANEIGSALLTHFQALQCIDGLIGKGLMLTMRPETSSKSYSVTASGMVEVARKLRVMREVIELSEDIGGFSLPE